MEDENCVSAATATPQPSVSITPNHVGSVSKATLGSNNTSAAGESGGGLMCVVGQDGQTLILSDAEGRENIISGVTPDILQQALQEVVEVDEPPTSVSNTVPGSIQGTSSEILNTPPPVLPQLVAMPSPCTSPSSSLNAALERLIEQQQHQQNNVSISAIDRNNQLLDQLAEAAGLNNTTLTNNEVRDSQSSTTNSSENVPIAIDLDPGIISPITISMTTSPIKTSPGFTNGFTNPPPTTQEKGFVTVFNGKDGTLRLTPETAKALGIDAHLRPPPQNNIILPSVNEPQSTVPPKIENTASISEQHQLQKSRILSNLTVQQQQEIPVTTMMTMTLPVHPSNTANSSFSLDSHLYTGLKGDNIISTRTTTAQQIKVINAIVNQEPSTTFVNAGGNIDSSHQDSLVGKAVTLNLPTTTQARKMILIPTTEPDGTVTYLLKSPSSSATNMSSDHNVSLRNNTHVSTVSNIQHQTNQPTFQIVNANNISNIGSNQQPQHIIQITRASHTASINNQATIVPLNITKPTVVGNRIHVPMRTSQNHSALLTNVMRPIMTTGVVHTTSQTPLHRHHPVILPRPPSLPTPSGSTSNQSAQLTTKTVVPKIKTQYKKKKPQPSTKKPGIILAVTTKETSTHSMSNVSNVMKTPSRLFMSNQQGTIGQNSSHREMQIPPNLEANAELQGVPSHFVIVESPENVALGSSHGSGKPFGTLDNPIQIVPEGNTFRSLQPISHNQVTSIAKVLKDTRPDFSDRKITYRDVDKKIEYKIIYPDEAFASLSQGRSRNTNDENDEFEEDDTDDDDEDDSLANLREPIYLSPEELLMGTHPFFTKSDARGPIRRKRGRPSAIERFSMMFRKPKDSAKRLRKEFGFSEKTANALQKDIVDDQNFTNAFNSNHEMMVQEDHEEEKITLSSSRTRSGRVSRPPIQIDQEFKTAPPASNPNETNRIIDTIQNNVPKSESITNAYVELPNTQEQPTPKAKRTFTVPPRYRCRVCHKMYLGDRKMNRHIKNYPGHGPIFEPPLPPPPPKMADEITHKIPTPLSSVPIIPLARNQLEDLVKNLDAELVLDVVGKKMFDNFSMWELQMKKASLRNEKGLKVLEKLFNDTEKVLSELKNLVDNCLTDTKLTEKACPSINMGEYVQLALSGHDSPWYLEQPNHVPTEYHTFFGIEPAVMSSMVSPRSESSNPGTLHQLMHVNPPEMDDNTSSLISGTSDKDGPSNSAQDGMGAQMVLEQNLGVANRSLDEDMEDDETQDGADDGPSSSSKKHHDSGSMQDDFLNAHDESSKLMSPISNQSEDESDNVNDKDDSDRVNNDQNNIHRQNDNPHCRNTNETKNATNDDRDEEEEDIEDDEVDPKDVLEQNGIDVTCETNYVSGSKEKDTFSKSTNIGSNDLAMEIDSLVPTLAPEVHESENSYQSQTTRLPSFSSIIAGSPKTNTRPCTDSNSEKVPSSVQPANPLECNTTVGSILSISGSHTHHDSMVPSPCVSDHNPGSVASVLSRHDDTDMLHHQVAAAIASQQQHKDEHLSLMSEHPVMTSHSRRSSLAHSEQAALSTDSRRSSIDHGGIISVARSFIDATGDVSANISSRRSSLDHNSVHSGPPSVDMSQQNQISNNFTSVVSNEVSSISNLAIHELPHSGPASVDLNNTPQELNFHEQQENPVRNISSENIVLKACTDHPQNITHHQSSVHSALQEATQYQQNIPQAANDLCHLGHLSHSGPPSVDVHHFHHLDHQHNNDRTNASSSTSTSDIQNATISTVSSLIPLIEESHHSPLMSTGHSSLVNNQRHIQSMPNSPLSSSTAGIDMHSRVRQIPLCMNTNSPISKTQPSCVLTEPLDLLSSLVDNTDVRCRAKGAQHGPKTSSLLSKVQSNQPKITNMNVDAKEHGLESVGRNQSLMHTTTNDNSFNSLVQSASVVDNLVLGQVGAVNSSVSSTGGGNFDGKHGSTMSHVVDHHPFPTSLSSNVSKLVHTEHTSNLVGESNVSISTEANTASIAPSVLTSIHPNLSNTSDKHEETMQTKDVGHDLISSVLATASQTVTEDLLTSTNAKEKITTSTTIPNHPTGSNNSNDASAHFLSDLESVLGDTNSFSFSSALNVDHHMSLKNNPTPEKLLMKSIPPASMMKPKKSKKTVSVASSSSSKIFKAKKGNINAPQTRTDFLGAFSDNGIKQQSVATTECSDNQPIHIPRSTTTDISRSNNSVEIIDNTLVVPVKKVSVSVTDTFPSENDLIVPNNLMEAPAHQIISVAIEASLNHDGNNGSNLNTTSVVGQNIEKPGGQAHHVLNEEDAEGMHTADIDSLSRLFDENVSRQDNHPGSNPGNLS